MFSINNVICGMPAKTNSLFQLAVIVSALGFFVDTYDLLLFAIIRKPSLAALGLSPNEVFTKGELLISIQMIGIVLVRYLLLPGPPHNAVPWAGGGLT